jgi:hypothetical protein
VRSVCRTTTKKKTTSFGLLAYASDDRLATRIAKFDQWAIANTKRLVNTNLPPKVEIGSGWDACIASLGRPAARGAIAALLDQGFQTTGDVENRLGYYIGQLPR